MKKLSAILVLTMLALLIGLAANGAQTNVNAVYEYTVGAGDVLQISVWKDDALSRQVPVLPDGSISFPLIGKVLTAGKTVEAIQKEIEQRIIPYVPEPNVSVSVLQVNSMLVYVVGRVNKPGRFMLTGNINVMQAIAMAGGLTPFAEGDEIKIMRKKNTQTILLDFNYDKVVKGKQLEQNIELQRGDVIVVP